MNARAWLSLPAALLALALSALPARAEISEPEYLVFGVIVLDEVQITAAETQYTVEARFEGEVIQVYRMGDNPDIGDRFLLTFPMNAIGPRTPGFHRPGDEIRVSFFNDGRLIVRTNITLFERGGALALDAVDTDGDDTFDFHDPDDDNDRILDGDDNCRVVPNRDQADFDGDGLGDACDDDDDNDDVPDTEDDLPFNADETSDGDGDGVGDNRDNCPAVSNPSQSDIDNDTLGDACDLDADEDGIPDDLDNCPHAVNPDQADEDDNGTGNVCDEYCAPVGRGARMILICL